MRRQQPPLRREDERQDEASAAERSHWFAQQLGERWQPDGAGVYRFVADGDEDAPAAAEARELDAQGTDVDDLIAQLSGDLRDAQAPSSRDG